MVPSSPPSPLPFEARPLAPSATAAALALAAAAGSHGAYVQNALAIGDGDALSLSVGGALRGVCWFGPRGNLIAVVDPSCDPALVARAVQQSRLPWRIALGPAPVVDALALLCSRPPLVHRDQIYYAATPADAAAVPAGIEVRLPVKADRDRLMRATLELNQADLNVDPARVDRRWLRDMVEERIAEGSTRVIGPVGDIACKLDLGSDGPGGLVLEGVFTFAAARGRGLATALVAQVIAGAATARVCLHVAAHNRPARAAYERAGMREDGRCRLLLLG